MVPNDACTVLKTTVCVTKEKVYHQLSCQTGNLLSCFLFIFCVGKMTSSVILVKTYDFIYST